jgi:peptide/nickel transport system permease protein
MSAAILTETALSYLGVGVKAPDTSLGLLISQNQQAFSTRPWLFWFPGLFIVLICLSINFIGDGLRDAFDPRQKKFNAKKAADHGGPAAQSSAPTALDGPEHEGFRPGGPADGTQGK